MSMQKILHAEVGSGGASSIDFTSIPQIYTDLYIKLSARERDAGDYVRFFLDINGTNSSISTLFVLGTGSAPSSSSGTNLVGHGINRYSSTAGVFGNVDIYIANYTKNANKAICVEGVEENDATAAYSSISAALWSNTTAISSISIVSPGNIAQYSSATLYGITAGSDGITTVS